MVAVRSLWLAQSGLSGSAPLNALLLPLPPLHLERSDCNPGEGGLQFQGSIPAPRAPKECAKAWTAYRAGAEAWKAFLIGIEAQLTRACENLCTVVMRNPHILAVRPGPGGESGVSVPPDAHRAPDPIAIGASSPAHVLSKHIMCILTGCSHLAPHSTF